MPTCALCGARPAAYLFTTPICSTCANSASVSVASIGADHAAIVLVHGDNRRRDIDKGPGSPGDEHWARRLRARMARLNEIKRDAAATDDPAFLKEFGAYVERHGHTRFAAETIRRQRARGMMMDQVLGVAQKPAKGDQV